MSEIKGQLLGIVLVAIIFGTVATALGVMFTNLTKKAEEKVSEILTSEYRAKPADNSLDQQLQSYWLMITPSGVFY